MLNSNEIEKDLKYLIFNDNRLKIYSKKGYGNFHSLNF